MSYQKHKEAYSNKYPAISDLAARAERRIPHVAWEYLSSGTGDEDLLDRNVQAFQNIQFVPEFCRGEIEASTEVELWGKKYAAPLGVAPIGLSGLMWPKVEQYLAAMAARWQIPYCLSTVATETPETVGPQVEDMGWFQLYPPKEWELCTSLLDRAKDSGFHVLAITADVPMASRRERSKRAGLAMPPRITPRLIWDGMMHPHWGVATLRRGLPTLRTVAHYTESADFKFVSGFVGNRLGGTLDWDYCQRIKAYWDGPVVLKGVLHPSDARKAIDIGLDGIWVSNHGARQFNGAPTSIEALPSIADAVSGACPIIFDSGVRTGLDMMRALHLGADFIMAGRPFIYGVAALGRYGGDHAAHVLIDDLKNNMIQVAAETIAAIRTVDRSPRS